MDAFICRKCAYAAFKQALESCPVCSAGKEQFLFRADAINQPADPLNLNELEKKHIPVISTAQGNAADGSIYFDTDIKVGQILHVMEPKHYIISIDVYIDYKFTSRCYFTPEKLNPVVNLHLRPLVGELIAVENCNIHGRWMAKMEIL